MKVKAKWQIAYNNSMYNAGDPFELKEEDVGRYINDVVIVSDTKWRNPQTKEVSERAVDTYQNREKFEEETGKKAFWMGKLTVGYISWLKNK